MRNRVRLVHGASYLIHVFHLCLWLNHTSIHSQTGRLRRSRLLSMIPVGVRNAMHLILLLVYDHFNICMQSFIESTYRLVGWQTFEWEANVPHWKRVCCCRKRLDNGAFIAYISIGRMCATKSATSSGTEVAFFSACNLRLLRMCVFFFVCFTSVNAQSSKTTKMRESRKNYISLFFSYSLQRIALDWVES